MATLQQKVTMGIINPIMLERYLFFRVGGEARSMQVVGVETRRARVSVPSRARAQRLRVVQTHVYSVAYL